MNQRHGLSNESHNYRGGERGMHIVHRTASLPHQPFYVVEQSNPGIATMNTNVPHSYQIPRHSMDSVDIPYSSASISSISSISSSPASFSPGGGHSPALQGGVYSHQPGTVGYAIQNATTVEQPTATPAYAQQVPHQSQMQQPEGQTWYPYQAHVEVATIGQLPPFGSGVYDIYSAPKLEFDDPTMQLPSARIESM